MPGGRCPDRVDGQEAVPNVFGIGSRPLWVTMALFFCGYVVVMSCANAGTTDFWTWVGALIGVGFFMVAAGPILGAPGDPMPMRTTLVVATLAIAGVAVSLFSLPSPLTHVMQTGPSIGASVIILAFTAVRGRPLAAWAGSAAISLVATVWGHVAGQGAFWGLAVTLPGYAIMLMGSLFSLMLRPMAGQLYALREANERQAALDAATAAATEVRERRLAALDERARPILTRIAEREEFTDDEVAVARLIEAQLRDGIRAPGLDHPRVRDAAWQARRRGVTVLLLDDGGLAADGEDTEAARRRLADAVARVLDETSDGRVTVRIQPPGRAVLASVSVVGTSRVERVDFDASDLAVHEVADVDAQ